MLRGLGGLLVGFVLPGGRHAEAQRYSTPPPVKPNAYIHIDSENIVTFLITKVEMGQGTVTSLSQTRRGPDVAMAGIVPDRFADLGRGKG